MKFDEYMSDVGKRDMDYGEIPDYRIFEVVEDTQDGTLSSSSRVVLSQELEQWLQELEAQPTNHVIYRLRLLICPWKSSETNRDFPFADEALFDRFSAVFALPITYPLIFAERQGVPVVISQVDQYHIGMICQTPDYGDYFTSMALTHDVGRRVTQGVLAVTHESVVGRDILDMLEQLSSYGENLLLLPSILYWQCAAIFRIELRECDRDMQKVQLGTGLLDNFLRRDKSPDTSNTTNQGVKGPDYRMLHQTLVEQHAFLTRGHSTFTTDLGIGCRNGLEEVSVILKSWGKESVDFFPVDFYGFLGHIDIDCKFLLHSRERLMSRVNVQLQVLYNLMQQHIADETKKDTEIMKTIADRTLQDAAQMKGIAVLTMFFLPTTALSSIFGMDPFFTNTAEGQLVVSTGFSRIFLAIAIPLTIIVLCIYATWIERVVVRKWWGERLASMIKRHREYKADPERANGTISLKNLQNKTVELWDREHQQVKSAVRTSLGRSTGP